MKPETINFESGDPLLALHSDQGLWANWFAGDSSGTTLPPSFLRASSSMKTVLNSAPENVASFSPKYASQLKRDLDFLVEDSIERELIAKSISDISSGAAQVVVTGQQPGFAGGPLYCLFKIATTVALAHLRSSRGRPTAAVFWMGDDDDDWRELLDPVLWDDLKGELGGSSLEPGPPRQRMPMIGSLSFSPLEDRTNQVLENLEVDEFGEELRKIYQEARTHGDSLSTLTEKILRFVFKGTGLVILKGNDPRLHSHCGEFYEKAMERLPELARLTKERAGLLAQLTGSVPLSSNSLNRPLYLSNQKSRHPWEGQKIPEGYSTLRCGVLLRSLLQDWLLAPAAVVVGPGELSYLSQLVPAYECLGITRSPLVPRLFGWILPKGFPLETLRKFNQERPLSSTRSLELAKMAGVAGEEKLITILMKELGLDRARAQDLSAGRTRRWVKGVQALLKNESRKQFERNQLSELPWVFPQGKRQERKLAWVPIVATWGRPLVEALLKASETHLLEGERGHWREYLFRVPDLWKTKGSGS